MCVGDDDVVTTVHWIKLVLLMVTSGAEGQIRTTLIVDRFVFAHEHYGDSFCEFPEDAV